MEHKHYKPIIDRFGIAFFLMNIQPKYWGATNHILQTKEKLFVWDRCSQKSHYNQVISSVGEHREDKNCD